MIRPYHIRVNRTRWYFGAIHKYVQLIESDVCSLWQGRRGLLFCIAKSDDHIIQRVVVPKSCSKKYQEHLIAGDAQVNLAWFELASTLIEDKNILVYLRTSRLHPNCVGRGNAVSVSRYRKYARTETPYLNLR